MTARRGPVQPGLPDPGLPRRSQPGLPGLDLDRLVGRPGVRRMAEPEIPSAEQAVRPRALGAMILVLAFCGYLASVNAAGVYVGGVIAIVDLLIMLVLFFGLRPST